MKLYQINAYRNPQAVFMGMNFMRKNNPLWQPNPADYDLVFDGDIGTNSLEEIYRFFNLDLQRNFRSMSVSDVVEIDGKFFYCDSIGFCPVEFDSERAVSVLQKKIRVLRIRPERIPEEVVIESDLRSLQNEVNGSIEAFYPFEDQVAIVCNEEGKFNGCSPNRAVIGKDGKIMDIIFGTFLICDASEEDFGSLNDEMIAKYKEVFFHPESFVIQKDGVKIIRH